MPKKCDLVGQKFGLLTVKKKVGQARDRSFIWACDCQCGNTINLSTWDLRSGKYINCGCATNKPKKLNNRRFGHLVVLEKAGNYNKLTIWRCRCDCGKEIEALAYQLKEGLVKSCGCLGNGPLPLKLKSWTKHLFYQKPPKKQVSRQTIYEFIRSLGSIRLKSEV